MRKWPRYLAHNGVPKTTAFQKSTFREFLEIVSDLTLGEVNRQVIVRYAEILRKLPKNRRKIHGDRPIQELIAESIPEKDRASERTPLSLMSREVVYEDLRIRSLDPGFFSR